MLRSICSLLLAGILYAGSSAGLLHAQAPLDLSFLTTRAESSDFEETTRYDELMAFVEVLASSSERVHLTRFGYSYEGRPLPLVVVGDVRDASPEAVRRADRLRVLVFANIHAGEVAGKEAALMLLRKLAAGGYASWRDSLVLLAAPLYNADGNEHVRLDHRPRQLGPVGGMGQRPNAQGYDLNRDHVKLDAPESRALVRLIDRYDPHVVVDLHTTNGTRHAYHLTYAPPLHPDTPAALDTLLRREWLPHVTRRLGETSGLLTWHYGNVPRSDEVPRGWYTFDYRPRFSNNYVGLRGRFGILSEAYAYLPFEDRIHATLYFTEEVLHYAARRADTLRALAARADAETLPGKPLTLRARHASSGKQHEVLMGAVEPVRHPYTGDTLFRRLDVVRPEPIPAYVSFEATDTLAAPSAYLVPPDQHEVIDRLQIHGIRVEALDAPERLCVERFHVDSLHVAERTYQGRRERTLYGAYAVDSTTVPQGTLRVPVDQPLGRLVFSLLEPRAADGLAAWGLVRGLAPGGAYPVLRVPAAPDPRAQQGGP